MHRNLALYVHGSSDSLIGEIYKGTWGVHTNTDFRVCSVLLDGLKGILRELFALVSCANNPENLGKFRSVLIIYIHQEGCFSGWGGRHFNDGLSTI